jgi:glycerol-3-phosphate acyltransferase PlsY
MKREKQQDATIGCLLLTSVSTCFGHHYAHLQENKGPVTAFGVLFWFCWMWLLAVVGRCLAGCEHCEVFCSNRKLHMWIRKTN